MKIYILPDLSLVIPKRADSDGVTGDTVTIVPSKHPDYDLWVNWFQTTRNQPIPIQSLEQVGS